MARCEDFPCCGHELGCCPDFDESGKQLNMICTCGAVVPLTSKYSICEACLDSGNEDDDAGFSYDDLDDDEYEEYIESPEMLYDSYTDD